LLAGVAAYRERRSKYRMRARGFPLFAVESCRSANDPIAVMGNPGHVSLMMQAHMAVLAFDSAAIVQRYDLLSFFKLRLSSWLTIALSFCLLFVAQAVYAQEGDPSSDAPIAKRTGSVTFFNKPGSASFSKFDDQSGLILFEARIEGKKILALLDTGSNYSLVSTQLVSELGINSEDVGEIIQATNSSQSSKRVSNLSFEHVGQYSMIRDFYTFDFSGMSDAVGRRVDAVIGYDLLRQLCFVLDSKFKRVLVLPSGMITPNDDRYATIELYGGVFQGTLNGNIARFAVDLGSNSDVSVYSNSWDRLFGKKPAVSGFTVTDASGERRVGERLDNVQLSAFGSSLNVSVTKNPLENENFDALLGYPLFSGRIAIFDYSKNVIYLERQQ